MKDNVEISHLTKFHAFRVTRDQVMDLETWFKIHTNFSNVETASQHYMVLGDDVSTLETFVWILNHVSRSITWFLFALKA